MTKRKELSELQIKFLEALFGEAQGDAAKAKILAGYSPTTVTSGIIRDLKEEIIEQAHLVLAQNSPRAALELVGLVVDPNQAGATNKLKAVQEILTRVGVAAPKQDQDINLKVPHGGLFIMPAKGSDHSIKETTNGEEASKDQ